MRTCPFRWCSGPADSAAYFEEIDRFILGTLGESARSRYRIIVDDPTEVARAMLAGMEQVRDFRRATSDAYYYNWRLHIDAAFQHPFVASHDNMRNLALHKDQPTHMLAANLRRAFSGVVSGNVKDAGIRAIEQHGLFEIRGDAGIMALMDELLSSFVDQQRMKLPGTAYQPCYRVIR